MAAKGAKQMQVGALQRKQPGAPHRAPMTRQPDPPRGRVFIRKERCKGCEFCVTFCPQQVLKMSKDFNAKGYHYPDVLKDECINCTLCISICPDYAIMSVPIPAGTPTPRKAPANAKA